MTSLSALDALILHNRGAFYEGQVFQQLKHALFTVRSFEFALADGAIHCGNEPYQSSSFAERLFLETLQLRDPSSTQWLPFDVKSTIEINAGRQFYLTTVAQLRHVAFYIGLCAADASYLALIPNFNQVSEEGIACENAEQREIAANRSVRLRLDARSYTLDPSLAPYLMPRSLLLEAVNRVRNHARGGPPYINPWNGVCFSQWRPSLRTAHLLIPTELSDGYSSFKATMEIFRVIRATQRYRHLRVELVDLQPRLADFKIILRAAGGTDLRQCLVQHKLDLTIRESEASLYRVPIARGQSDNAHSWYFSTTDRFDFLWYQFRFSQERSGASYSFFFMPESVIPDEFYQSHQTEVSFQRPGFRPYFHVMDDDGYWVEAVWQTILEHPRPRRPGLRPLRSVQDPRNSTRQRHTPNPEVSNKRQAPDATISDADTSLEQRLDSSMNSQHGRHLYRLAAERAHRVFFHDLMAECARRRSGIIVALSADHALGDYGFTPYAWTKEECELFDAHQVPPRRLYQLGARTPIVTLFYFVRDLECSWRGPELSIPQFRRLNSDPRGRLTVWDLFGPDRPPSGSPLCVIPSTDIAPTESQRDLFRQGIDAMQQRRRTPRTPTVSAMLCQGTYTPDYTVDAVGPLVHQAQGRGGLWELLMAFARPGPVSWPKHIPRQDGEFRHSLRDVHLRLVEDDIRSRQYFQGAAPR